MLIIFINLIHNLCSHLFQIYDIVKLKSTIFPITKSIFKVLSIFCTDLQIRAIFIYSQDLLNINGQWGLIMGVNNVPSSEAIEKLTQKNSWVFFGVFLQLKSESCL